MTAKPPADRERRRLVLLVVLLVGLAVALVLTYRPGAPADAGALPVLNVDVGRGAMQGAVERNVFRFYDSPTPTRTPVPPTPTPVSFFFFPPAPTPVLPTPTPTPIIPPNVPFKVIGIIGPKDRPIIVLEEGGRLINARETDTLDNRFIVRKINRESVDFAFVGLPPDITRRLPVP